MAFADDVRTAAKAADEAAQRFAYLNQVATAAGVSVTEAAKAIDRAEKQRQQTLRAARDAVLGLALSFKGLALAGVRQSVEYERLRLVFDRLTFSIGNIFKPTIDAVTNKIIELTTVFNNLTGEQQSLIRNLSLTVGGVLLLSRVLGSLGFALGPIGLVFSVLAVVAAQSGAAGPILSALGKLFEALVPIFKGLGDVIKLVADVVGLLIRGLALLVDFVLESAQKLVKAVPFGGLAAEGLRRDVERQGQAPARLARSGTEGATNIGAEFLRIQQAALKTDPILNEAKKQTETQGEIFGIVSGILQSIQGNNPPDIRTL